MRYKSDQKEATRQRILHAIGRGFRRLGFAGAGVDGLARDAGVTSGAFYTHFDSKAAAFREAVASGVGEFIAAVEQHQNDHGADWLNEFARFYLGEKRTCDLADSCALQTLSPEVGRSDDQAVREIFQTELLQAADAIASGLPLKHGAPDREAAWTILATLVGGVTLARAVQDRELADTIGRAVSRALTREDTST